MTAFLFWKERFMKAGTSSQWFSGNADAYTSVLTPLHAC